MLFRSVTYFQYTAGGTLEADFLQLQGEKINYTVTASNAGTITLNNKITTLTNNSLMYGVTVDVLSGQNLDNYDWNILDSHLVLYRRNVPMASNKNMLVSNFESFNIQMVGGINKFEYSFPVNKSCYNAYALLPTATNLYSQAQNMKLYQFSVNNKPFTTIYMDLTTSLHNDNMVRALDNSLYYQPKNLNQDRDDDEAPNPTSIDPVLIPCKLYQSMMKGAPVVNEPEIGRAHV